MKPALKLKIVEPPDRPLGPLTTAEKLIAAKKFLGDRWILHPAHSVKRLTKPWGDRT